MQKQIFIALFALMGISVGVFAQTATPGINRTQAEQQRRIHEGAATGQLTRHEIKKLEKQQRKIEWDKLKAKSDGVVTRHERRHIQKEQEKAARKIYKEKHDVQVRH
jgi:hypothetical protein